MVNISPLYTEAEAETQTSESCEYLNTRTEVGIEIEIFAKTEYRKKNQRTRQHNQNYGALPERAAQTRKQPRKSSRYLLSV